MEFRMLCKVKKVTITVNRNCASLTNCAVDYVNVFKKIIDFLNVACLTCKAFCDYVSGNLVS